MEEEPTKAERKLQRRQEKQQARNEIERRRKRARSGRWAAAAIGLAVLAGGVIWAAGQADPGGEGPVPAVNDADWIKGNEAAAVTLIEYGDFQCPACGAFYPVLKSVEAELGDKVRVVYRHFPLRQPHPQAQLAAQAAEAAGGQGKFWEMHDLLFERQGAWSGNSEARDIFIAYAEELGMDKDRFVQDLESDATEEAVEADYRGGVGARIYSTPTFYMNGEKLEVRSLDDFQEKIRQAAAN